MKTIPYHRVYGTVSEWLGASIVKIRPVSPGNTGSKLDDLSSLTLNLTNARELGSLNDICGKTVEVTISSIPDHKNDIVFANLTLLSAAKGRVPRTKLFEQAQNSLIALRDFMLEWSSGIQQSGVFSSTTQVTFLFSDQRYTERTLVKLELQNAIGRVSLPDSEVLTKHLKVREFDSTNYTFSLRSGGSLCIISRDAQEQDFVFWINAQSSMHWMRTMSILPN